MCTYINSNVVLANLLLYSQKAERGVAVRDIEVYCSKVKDALFADKNESTRSVLFLVNAQELNSSLYTYPTCFRQFAGRYYKGIGLFDGMFDCFMSESVRRIMRSVAEQI